MKKENLISACIVLVCAADIAAYCLAANSDGTQNKKAEEVTTVVESVQQEEESVSAEEHYYGGLVSGVSKAFGIAQMGGSKVEDENVIEKQDTPTMSSDGDDVYSKYTEIDEAHMPNLDKTKDANSSSEDLQIPDDVKENLEQYSGDFVEFVGFEDQTLSDTFKMFIFSNLESNQYSIGFKVLLDGEEVCTIDPISPGNPKIVDMYTLLPKGKNKVTIISTAYAGDGTQLNSISQDVYITVEKSSDATISEVQDQSVESSESYFKTDIVYVSSANLFTITIPAVVTVNEGEFGTAFDVGICAKNIRQTCKISITANDESINNFILKSASGDKEDLGNVKYSVTGNLTYKMTAGDSQLHWIGPAYCTLEGSARAGLNYYGVITFKLIKEV